MKKSLLVATLLISGLANSQSLTQGNEPAIGETQSMYLCDSFATNYSGVTGSGVTWDYSDIAGYWNQSKDINILDATTTVDYSYFPGSAKAFEIGNSVITYFNSDAAHRYSQGFKFYEPSMGDVYTTFENDSLNMVEYPFAYGSSLSDVYDGSIQFIFNSIPVDSALNGNAYAWIDGEGTLMFPLGVNISNVIRYKAIDTSYTNLPIIGQVEVIREQYEYYETSSSNLPLFIHVTITMESGGLPLAEVSLVLSLYTPQYWMGVEENNELNFGLFPNPTNELLSISGNYGQNASAEILDQAGRSIMNIELNELTNVDVSSLEPGVYFIQVIKDGSMATKQFVKQ